MIKHCGGKIGVHEGDPSQIDPPEIHWTGNEFEHRISAGKINPQLSHLTSGWIKSFSRKGRGVIKHCGGKIGVHEGDPSQIAPPEIHWTGNAVEHRIGAGKINPQLSHLTSGWIKSFSRKGRGVIKHCGGKIGIHEGDPSQIDPPEIHWTGNAVEHRIGAGKINPQLSHLTSAWIKSFSRKGRGVIKHCGGKIGVHEGDPSQIDPPEIHWTGNEFEHRIGAGKINPQLSHLTSGWIKSFSRKGRGVIKHCGGKIGVHEGDPSQIDPPEIHWTGNAVEHRIGAGKINPQLSHLTSGWIKSFSRKGRGVIKHCGRKIGIREGDPSQIDPLERNRHSR